MSLSYIIIYAISIFVLILCSAFFSSSETALTKASRARIFSQKREGNRKAELVEKLLEQPEALLSSILLGNNIVNILATSLATALFLTIFGEAGVAMATVMMTLLLVIFAEIMPKTYAIRNADRLALIVVSILHPLVILLKPINWLLKRTVELALTVLGLGAQKEGQSDDSTEEELRGVIEMHGESEEDDNRDERNMLRSILDLSEVSVQEVFTHRKSVEMIDISMGAEEILKQVLASPFTRFPLYDQNPDQIIGILHSKALLRAVRTNEAIDKINIKEIAHDPWFILDTTSLVDQLKAFRARSAHFALVIDEYGSFAGIVTLEDIIEEIVGDITDEHDVSVPGLTPKPDGSFVIEGSMTIRDINRALDVILPDEEAVTLAGLLMHEARRIPQVGDMFHFYGFGFRVLERRRLQVTSIQLWLPDKGDA